jgi:hypothetical protein
LIFIICGLGGVGRIVEVVDIGYRNTEVSLRAVAWRVRFGIEREGEETDKF